MEAITLLLTIPPIAYVWVHVILGWMGWKLFKPLNCVPCLSFWLFVCVALCISPELIIFAATAYIIGAILDRYVI